jgi:carbon storage regulator CsrA
MLVLTRKKNEVIVLSNKESGEVLGQVHILGSSNGQVRVGIDSPKTVLVDRYEIYEKKLLEKGSKLRELKADITLPDLSRLGLCDDPDCVGCDSAEFVYIPILTEAQLIK